MLFIKKNNIQLFTSILCKIFAIWLCNPDYIAYYYPTQYRGEIPK